MTTLNDTAAKLLDAAERMTKSVGYQGLSFRDLAAAVGVRSASVHYHFPTKGDLGAAVARRYADRFLSHLKEIDARRLSRVDALAAYVALFRNTLMQDGRMCLCGMLAAETDVISQQTRAEVCRFVDANVDWVAGVLRGRAGAREAIASRRLAQALFAALEGAMLVSRVAGDIAVFDAIVSQYAATGLFGAHRSSQGRRRG